ncbi:hypothetical protein LIER_29420 [Lithospermum erythrorhizon]|uniref:Uncharacterized protein n=1 Tax=Lithospermum erythrorhizon TaxID=34254 RepID=A0AAV3RKN5_LITER
MAGNIMLKGHLRHLRKYYRIHPDVLMRAPLANETPDLLEDGYTPMFWEFFNYGLRLPALAFVNLVLTTIGSAPGQMGPFAWTTLTAFQRDVQRPLPRGSIILPNLLGCGEHDVL